MLEESFRRRWGVAEVAPPPPAAPAYAAVRAQSWVLAHRLEGRDSLAALAVRYGTDTTQLKRLNNLMSEHALAARWAGAGARPSAVGGGQRWEGLAAGPAFTQGSRPHQLYCAAALPTPLPGSRSSSSGALLAVHVPALTTDVCRRRSHLYVPVADPAAAAAGKRCAFLRDEHSRRRLVAVLRDGDDLLGGGGGGGGKGRERSRDFVVAKLAEVLQASLLPHGWLSAECGLLTPTPTLRGVHT